jgi:hypothetical protein
MFKEDYSIQPFTGSIDALLEQSMKLDPDAIALQVEQEKYNHSTMKPPPYFAIGHGSDSQYSSFLLTSQI